MVGSKPAEEFRGLKTGCGDLWRKVNLRSRPPRPPDSVSISTNAPHDPHTALDWRSTGLKDAQGTLGSPTG